MKNAVCLSAGLYVNLDYHQRYSTPSRQVTRPLYFHARLRNVTGTNERPSVTGLSMICCYCAENSVMRLTLGTSMHIILVVVSAKHSPLAGPSSKMALASPLEYTVETRS